MFHYLQLGHFDQDALRQHKVIPVKPLDMDLAQRLFLQAGGMIPPNGTATIDGCVVNQEEGGYLTCEIPVRDGKAVEFISRLAQETGCGIAYAEGGGSETVEQFLASYRVHDLSPT